MPRTTTIMALAGALTLLGCGDDAHSVGEPADEAWPAQRSAPAASDDETTAANEMGPAPGETANDIRVGEDRIAANELEPARGEAAAANDTRVREEAIAVNELEPVSGETATGNDAAGNEAAPTRGETATANETTGPEARTRPPGATAQGSTTGSGADTREGVPTGQRASESEDGWPDFGIWDDDADVRISRREFLRGVDRSYPMWERFDDDADGSVSRQEMVSGLYGAWRGEDALSGRDLRSAVTRWFGVDWSVERVDDAGVVSRAELDDFLDRHGVFEALDRDADRSLDPFELGLAFFEHWDLNDDGFIDEVEWISA